MTSTYDKFPFVKVEGFKHEAWQGAQSIVETLSGHGSARFGLVIDCYPGVRIDEIVDTIVRPLGIQTIIYSDEAFVTGDEITQRVQRYLTDDRVFGILSNHVLSEFIDESKIRALREKINQTQESYCVIGVGAHLITRGDVLVYADLARWEIQQRYRSQELANWKCSNYTEDILRKYKRGFFFEWRMADRHKRDVFKAFDYLLDTNTTLSPKLITSNAFFAGLNQTVSQPFRTVPFFDPGVWGGQWMKSVCGLDDEKPNYAWCFDGVPEENSLFLKYGEVKVQIPSINVVFTQARQLLGEAVHARFGMEFPIRFDFLDTMDGQNLSLQVHPLTEYIQEKFGMHYTQDESYYILDAKHDGKVYLGVKTGIDPSAMIEDIKQAQTGQAIFSDELYINSFPAKKHDHFLIPAGTIHCSGKDTMVLEISATPYIFTFKLWDWNRLGLDGLPRPVHIEHGEQVIQYDRDTEWVQKNLINAIEIINDEEGFLEECTGLHERQFIETRRYTFNKPITIQTRGSVQMMNLVEGSELVIESPTQAFEPYVVHYVETWIIPASLGTIILRPVNEAYVKVICASVRH